MVRNNLRHEDALPTMHLRIIKRTQGLFHARKAAVPVSEVGDDA